jgi:predicted ABC-type exoprotein transport system permease subunit
MQFLDKSPAGGEMRAAYLKTMFGGTLALSIVIFAIFSIYWGSLWKTPLYALPGWIVVRCPCSPICVVSSLTRMRLS